MGEMMEEMEGDMEEEKEGRKGKGGRRRGLMWRRQAKGKERNKNFWGYSLAALWSL